MSKLYYKNEYRGELTEQQANRIKESLNQKPKPAQLTINGELLKTAQIEIFNDTPDTDSIQENKTFKDKMERTKKEIEVMRKWDIERKIDFNITRNFSVKYLLRVGYTNYLGKDWDKNGWEWWWQEFERRYMRENEEDYLQLRKVLKTYFEEYPDRYWCSSEIYNQFLPESKNVNQQSEAKGFVRIGEVISERIF